MSDTSLDYPLGIDPMIMLDEVQAKTVCASFEEALDAAEKLYGYHLKFSFAKSDVGKLIDSAGIYSDEEKRRVETIIFHRCGSISIYFESNTHDR